MDLVEEILTTINSVTAVLGKRLSADAIEVIDRGCPHTPQGLSENKMGVYTFYYEGRFLKIGKAGPNSSDRFARQHYTTKGAPSTLALSILADNDMRDKGITPANVGSWIKQNCRRIDILIDTSLGIFTLNLIEAVLHYKYEPKYEGFKSQR